MAILSLIFSILAMVGLSIFSLFGGSYLAVIFSIIGIILAVIVRKKDKTNQIVFAALVMSITAFILSIIISALYLAMVVFVSQAFNNPASRQSIIDTIQNNLIPALQQMQ